MSINNDKQTFFSEKYYTEHNMGRGLDYNLKAHAVSHGLQSTGQTWAEFSTLKVAVCMQRILVIIK